MSNAATISRQPPAGNPDLVTQIRDLTIALTESEYHVATILAFDPDAQVPAGHLAGGNAEQPTRILPGDAMNLSAWRMLVRAVCGEARSLDDTAGLALFLAERARQADEVLAPEVGARVRIRARQRIGGDRYAGREGVIVKNHFAGFYVKLDISPRERSQKTELIEADYLDVLSRAAVA